MFEYIKSEKRGDGESLDIFLDRESGRHAARLRGEVGAKARLTNGYTITADEVSVEEPTIEQLHPSAHWG